MRFIVGLGNPGPQYENTRHNVGFLLLDKLSDLYQIPIKKRKYLSLLGSGLIDGQELLLVKPLTFMNLSGKSVKSICDFYKCSTEDFIVVHDDLDLELGRIKVKIGGGDGGHRGVKSISQCLQTPNFYRIRLGIGRPSDSKYVSDYVLSPFNRAELKEINESFNRGIEEVEKLIRI